MRKLGILIFGLALGLLVAPTDASVIASAKTAKGKPVVETCELSEDQSQCTVPLVAGQNLVVGEVVVDLEGDPVVTFSITNAGWMITETHVYLGEAPPEKSAPGSFPFQHTGLYSDSDQYFQNEVGDHEGCSYVAVHAVVEKDCLETVDLTAVSATVSEVNALGTVQVSAQYVGEEPDAGSYWTIEVAGGGTLDGVYPAWCVDLANGLASGGPYDAEIYSSYDALPDLIKSRLDPEQLDMVNYILNQEWACTALEVQDAIWAALGQVEAADLTPCALEIYNEALGASAAYLPPCGGVVGVIVAPEYLDDIGQILIGQITALELEVTACVTDDECGEETAWGLADTSNSCEFPKGTGWGTYFLCCSGSNGDPCDSWLDEYFRVLEAKPDQCVVPE